MSRKKARWQRSTEVSNWQLRHSVTDDELPDLLALAKSRKIAGYDDAPRILAEIERRKKTASATRERELQGKLF